MTHQTYEFNGDFKAEMHRYIDESYEKAKTLNTSRESRMKTADSMIEAYYEQTGILPDSVHLERLGSLILREELTDSRMNKVTLEDLPILSDRQLERRVKSEVSDVWAETVATDGKNYQRPTRDNLRKLR